MNEKDFDILNKLITQHRYLNIHLRSPILLVDEDHCEKLKEFVIPIYWGNLDGEIKAKLKSRMVTTIFDVPYYKVKNLEVPYIILDERYRGEK